MLEKVIIHNFRSLRDIEVDLKKVNLLIGPNNSGKSNFLKALQYFSTVNNLKKLGNVEFKSNQRLSDNVLIFMNIEKDKLGYFHFIKEKDELDGGYFDIILNNPDLLKYETTHKLNRIIYTKLNKDNISNAKLTRFNKEFKNLKIYRPDPNKLRSYQNLGAEEYIEEDTSNLVSFLDNMRDSKPEVLDAIVNDLKICIPNFEDIRFRKEQDNVSKKQIGLIDKNRNIFWSDELSEGVLYFLAILAILHQPNPPKILLLEEPERNVHPRRIKEILDLIFRLSEEKNIQVIMTTHSILVVDEFKNNTDAVFVFDMKDGETKIKNLKTDIIDVSNNKSKEKGFPLIDYTKTLGEKWLAGFLGGVPLT